MLPPLQLSSPKSSAARALPSPPRQSIASFLPPPTAPMTHQVLHLPFSYFWKTNRNNTKYYTESVFFFTVVLQGAPQRFKMENPFQMGGPGNMIEVDDVKEGTLVRVTLPGVGPDGFKVWAEKNTVFFAGKGEIEMEGEESGRNYGGSLEFNPELNRAEAVKAEMKNGILKLLVPSAGSTKDKEDN